jgi:hypothetical protein
MQSPTGSPARPVFADRMLTRPLRAGVNVLLVGAVAGLTVGFGARATQQPAKPLLQYLMVGAKRIAFESPEGTVARFRYVDQALGPARRPGAARDEHPMSACYRPVADSLAGPMTLLFESDEMGNPEDLTEFELIPVGSRPEVERGCAKLGVAAGAIVTDRGIRLGLTRAAVLRVLGTPVRDRDDVAEFEVTTERTTRVGGTVDHYDVFSSITVTFRDGRVVAFSGAIGDTD